MRPLAHHLGEDSLVNLLLVGSGMAAVAIFWRRGVRARRKDVAVSTDSTVVHS